MSTVISMDYLRTLTNAINGLTDAGKRAVEAQVRAIIARNDGVGIVDLVDEILEAIEPYLDTVAQNAASLSAQSYDLIRYEAVDSTLGATPYTGRVPEATRKAVRGIAEYHSQNTEAFVHELLNRVDYEAKRAAGQTTFENGKDDPKRPRYARVPTGPETCRFCVMLASRGFVYHSEKSAGALNHFHPNCDCRIIPGFDGMAVDGYDPDEYMDLWVKMEEEGIDKLSSDEGRGKCDAIAGVEPGEPMDFYRADGGRANPHFGESRGYGTNCQTCVVANELRRRGYDVEALPNDGKNKVIEFISTHTNHAWIDPETGKPPEYIVSDKVKSAKSAYEWLKETVEPGARYTVEFSWKGRGNSGHIVCIERDDVGGELRLFDPQSSRRYYGAEIRRYFEAVKYRMVYHGRRYQIPPQVLRVDTLEPNLENVNRMLKKAGT